MQQMVFGYGVSPETMNRATRAYIDAWHWRSTNHETWCSIIGAACSKAANGERISTRSIIAGAAPQRFAPIMARWLASEHPSLLPFIETRRCVFDCFSGSTHGC